jgi:hypothetical protein
MATQEEMDKIIADALADSKKQSKWHRPSNKGLSADKIREARKILNFLFMSLFVVALIIYFVLPEQRPLFFCVGFGAMILKIVEFVLRFMF